MHMYKHVYTCTLTCMYMYVCMGTSATILLIIAHGPRPKINVVIKSFERSLSKLSAFLH